MNLKINLKKTFGQPWLLIGRLVLPLVILGCTTSWCGAQVNVNATQGTTGPTGYATLNAAFAAINAGTHQGAIQISIVGNTTEPATPTPLLASGGTPNYTSIVIKPSGGDFTINSAASPSANRGIIELAGADNVTIDGDDPATPGGRNLSIVAAANSTDGIACIRLSSNSTSGADGANNNTIKNCILTGSRSSATSTTVNYGIQFSNGTGTSSSSTGAYSSINTLIQNNIITRCYNGIYAYGNSNTYPNTGTQIISNILGTAVSGYTDETSVGSRGIYISYSATATSGGAAIIRGNDIRGGGATGYSGLVAGIYLEASNYGAIIEKNNIHDLSQPSSSGYGPVGIYFTGVSDQVKVQNNFISKLNGYTYSTSSTSSWNTYGIYIGSALTNLNINFNTIALNGTMAGSTANAGSNCIVIASSTATLSSLRNNILVNLNSSTNAYALYCSGTGNISAGTVDHNDYYTPSCNVGYYSSARTTLADWKAATSKDAASFDVNPNFASGSDLHIASGSTPSFLESTGIAITGIENDIDGDSRPGPAGSVNGGGTAPDIGADEFDGTPPLAQDLQALQLQAPAVAPLSCYATTKVTIRIKNAGSQAINLAANNAAVQGTVTAPGGAETLFSVDTLTGTLAVGAIRDVDVLLSYDMSATGDYTFDAITTMNGDQYTANDQMATATRSNTVAPVPQFVGFAGYSNDATLNTQYPGWHEASGNYGGTITYPGNGSFTSLSSTEANAYGNGARLEYYSSTNGWIISPKVAIPAAGYFYGLKARVVGYNSTTAKDLGANDTARIMISTDCGATWTPILTINSTDPHGLTASLTGFQEINVPLDDYAGENIQVALYARRTTGTSPDLDLIVKDIQISNCLAPNNLAATTTAGAPGTANISWTAPATLPADGYEYKIVSAGVGVDTGTAQSQGTTAAGVTNAAITVADPYIASYDLYVRSVCATGTTTSGWAGPFNFKTSCAAPTTPATDLALTPNPTSILVKFTKVSNATGYLVVRTLSTASAPTPVDGNSYSSGSTVNPGAIAVYNGTDSTYTNSSLTQNTEYRYWIFPYTNTPCTGGPVYYTATPLTGTAITCPAVPTAETAFNPTTQGFDIYWEPPTAGGNAAPLTYDIQIATNSGFTQDIQDYTNVTATYTVTGLSDYTKYWFRVRANNGCDGGWTSGTADTTRTLALGCTTPTAQPTNLALTANAAGTAIAGTFTGSDAGNYLVVRTTNGVVPTAPADGTLYTVGATDVLGANTTIVKIDTAKTFNNTGLTPNAGYDYYIFAYNHYACNNGPKYLTTAPLHGADTTCAGPMSGVNTSDITYSGFTINWNDLTGGSAMPVIYTLEVTTDAGYNTSVAGSPFTINNPTISQVISGLSPETDYYYRIKATNTACTNDWKTGMQRTKCHPPAIISSTGGTHCGPGSITLAATTDEAGATINWYADETGGTPLGSDNSFETPEINSTTSYWVSASGGVSSEGGGILNPTSTSGYLDNNAGVVFTALTDMTINSATVYPIGNGTLTFQITNSSGNEIAATNAISVTGNSSGTTPVVVPINIDVPAGTGYRLLLKSYTGITNLIRESGIGGYPYPSPSGNFSVTGGYWDGSSSSYYYFYNINVTTACVSERTEVVATITPSQPINAGSDIFVCAGSSAPLNVTSSNADYAYTWSPAAGLSGTTGSSITATPATNTQYVVKGEDPGGCVAYDTVAIAVNPLPDVPVSLTPADTTICSGQSVMLTADASLSGNDTIGTVNASNTTYYAPINRDYNYSTSKLLYTSDELNINGNITGIGIYKISGSNTSTINDVQIYMKNTAEDIVTTDTTDLSTYQLVYSGSYPNNAASGWMNVELDAPFDYDGTNLSVIFVKGYQAYISTYPKWAYTSTDIYRAAYYYDDDDPWDFYDYELDSRTYNRPNMRFEWSGNNSVQWSPVAGLYKDEMLTETVAASDTNTIVYAAPAATVTYSVSAVKNGCTSAALSSTVTVNSFSASLEATGQPSTCSGSNGSITISGLTNNNEYNVSYTVDGNVASADGLIADVNGNITVNGLSAGTYTDISVDEVDGCSSAINGTVTLTDPPQPVINSASTNSADCGIENGSITFNVPNMAAFTPVSVSYQKDGGSVASQSFYTNVANNITLENLAGGAYSNIIITNTTTQCSSATPYGPVTINTSAVADNIAPASSDKTYNQGANSTVSYTTSGCELIATIDAVNGSLSTVNAAVMVSGPAVTDAGQPYMGRYYALTAANNIGAHVTIYLNQSDIDAYNAMSEIGGEYPSIGANLENLQLTVFHSTPGSGSGILGYNDDPATKQVVDFNQMIITPPSGNNDYWSVAFDVDSFSLLVPHSNVSGAPLMSGAPLPVKLVDISATNMGSTNRVDWQTATEADGDRFAIERSRDAKTFIVIGEADAKGVTTGSRYSFIDASPYEGVSYYRLQLINNDGYKYASKVVSATVKVPGFKVTAYPNPVADNLTVKVDGVINGTATVLLTDALGREISRKTIDNNGTVVFSMSGLAQGMYLVKYMDNENIETIKVNKQ